MFDWTAIPLFLLGALATARLTVLVIEDRITEPLRNRIWEKYPPYTYRGFLFTCPWCISIYAATFLVVIYLLIPYVAIVLSCILALSYLASIADEVRHR